MVTPQTQIKINLPVQLRDFLASKAQKFGVPIASYVKLLILKEVEKMDYPEFELSERSKKALKEALKNKDKAIKVTGDIKTFLENL